MNVFDYLETIENDPDHNSGQLAIIRDFRARHGAAWLGKINLYRDEPEDHAPIKEWDGVGPVYTFSCDFVLPRFDPLLEEMILDRRDVLTLTTFV